MSLIMPVHCQHCFDSCTTMYLSTVQIINQFRIGWKCYPTEPTGLNNVLSIFYWTYMKRKETIGLVVDSEWLLYTEDALLEKFF